MDFLKKQEKKYVESVIVEDQSFIGGYGSERFRKEDSGLRRMG